MSMAIKGNYLFVIHGLRIYGPVVGVWVCSLYAMDLDYIFAQESLCLPMQEHALCSLIINEPEDEWLIKSLAQLSICDDKRLLKESNANEHCVINLCGQQTSLLQERCFVASVIFTPASSLRPAHLAWERVPQHTNCYFPIRFNCNELSGTVARNARCLLMLEASPSFVSYTTYVEYVMVSLDKNGSSTISRLPDALSSAPRERQSDEIKYRTIVFMDPSSNALICHRSKPWNESGARTIDIYYPA